MNSNENPYKYELDSVTVYFLLHWFIRFRTIFSFFFSLLIHVIYWFKIANADNKVNAQKGEKMLKNANREYKNTRVHIQQ